MRAFVVFHPVVGDEVFIDYICVDAKYRGCGYGRQILEHIDRPAQLIVGDGNRRAKRLYAHADFLPFVASAHSPGIGETSWRRARRGRAVCESCLPSFPWRDVSSDICESARSMGTARAQTDRSARAIRSSCSSHCDSVNLEPTKICI